MTVENDRITSLVEKPETVTTHFLGCGTYIFSTAIFDAIDNTPPSRKTHRVELTDVIEQLVRNGADVRPALLKGGYRNINYPEDYNSAMNLYRKIHFDEYKISLVIPAYKEDAAIGQVIEDLSDQVDEIVVADNCSPDGTGDIAREAGAKVISESFAGYGAALRRALDAATGDILVLMEGDGISGAPGFAWPARPAGCDCRCGRRTPPGAGVPPASAAPRAGAARVGGQSNRAADPCALGRTGRRHRGARARADSNRPGLDGPVRRAHGAGGTTCFG